MKRGFTIITLISFVVLLAVTASKAATAPDEEWFRTFGFEGTDFGYSLDQTSDGGYIIVGETWTSGSGQNYSDVYLIKTDGDGNVGPTYLGTWEKTFGGYGNDFGYSVQQTSDGGYIISGFTSSLGPYANDVYLIKTDSLLSSLNFGCRFARPP